MANLVRFIWVVSLSLTIVGLAYSYFADQTHEVDSKIHGDVTPNVLGFLQSGSDQQTVAANVKVSNPSLVTAVPSNDLISDVELLVQIEQALPNNRYWLMASPTEDESLIEARAFEKRVREKRYGEIMAGYASQHDIDEHFADVRATSIDFIEFSEYVLENYANALGPQNLQMHRLSVELHQSRLADLEDQKSAAYAAMDEAKLNTLAWQTDPAAYEAKLALEREAAMANLVVQE
jgi:hypothetical protein